jgi:rare lipoprotein A
LARRRFAATLRVMTLACSSRIARLALFASLLAGCASSGPPPETVEPHDGRGRVSADPSAAPHGEEVQARPEAGELAVRDVQTGLASWYGDPFHGRQTASGEIFDQNRLTAAHPTWPLRSLARVTRLETGQSVLVRINDRGPFVDGRIIDLSRAAAEELGFIGDGLAQVRVESLGPADPRDRAARSRIVTRD